MPHRADSPSKNRCVTLFIYLSQGGPERDRAVSESPAPEGKETPPEVTVAEESKTVGKSAAVLEEDEERNASEGAERDEEVKHTHDADSENISVLPRYHG